MMKVVCLNASVTIGVWTNPLILGFVVYGGTQVLCGMLII